jgi:ABC-type polysaccharide/polyol phosphate export permease
MNPLIMVVVYTIAFTYILRIHTEAFVFYLLLGILAWTFFANAVSMATGAIVDNTGIVKSVFFPRAILPIATVFFNFTQYGFTVAVFLPAMWLFYGLTPSPAAVLFPLFLALQVVFTIGVALMLATATVFFRDVRHLLEVALPVMFWTTPIVYELTLVPDELRLPILLSPMSSFIVAYHRMFYYGTWPEPLLWIIAACYAGAAFLAGMWLMLACEDRLGEQL